MSSSITPAANRFPAMDIWPSIYGHFPYCSYIPSQETSLYYLQSRYYNPEIGRFINADAYASTGQGIQDNNMFAYCQNNPVMCTDSSGRLPKWAAWGMSGAAIVVGIILCATGVGGIAGGVLIGAGAGSLINGYATEAAGGDFAAGYIGGAISGGLCGTGAGLGGLAFSAASEATNLVCLGYLSLGAAASFAGGFTGNITGSVYTEWHESGFQSIDVDWKKTIATSTVTGSFNVLAGIGSGISTILGGAGQVATEFNSRVACGVLAGTVAGGTEAAFDLIMYLISVFS